MLLSITGCTSEDTTTQVVESEKTESSIEADYDFGANTALEKTELTIEQMLQYAIQDEYFARQEYELIMEEYGELKPFINIIKAEETHIELLKDIFKAYGYDIPEDNAIEYTMVPDKLEDIYDIGVQAEIDNIAMYEKFLGFELPDDIRDVFTVLRDGSINHLAAFEKGPRGNGQGR